MASKNDILMPKYESNDNGLKPKMEIGIEKIGQSEVVGQHNSEERLLSIITDFKIKVNQDLETKTIENGNVGLKIEATTTYTDLIKLHESDIIINVEKIKCYICYIEDIKPGDGIVLKGCLHTFCLKCLVDYIKDVENIQTVCPYNDNFIKCDSFIEDRELRALISKDFYYKLEMKSLQMFQEIDDLASGGVAVNKNQASSSNQPFSYEELKSLYNDNLVLNITEFQCPICYTDVEIGSGVKIKNCLHEFCKFCLLEYIKQNEEIEIKCPHRDENSSCECRLDDREVKALVPSEIYEKIQMKSLQMAEANITDSFHCRTANCSGWCILEPGIAIFLCPVCLKENCLNCKAIHTGLNCLQYEDKRLGELNSDEATKRTNDTLLEMVAKGLAMHCPICQVVVIKDQGCSWIQCSICKTEICWATQGPRWGKLGRGDNSGGCRCNVNGKLCHVLCGNCH